MAAHVGRIAIRPGPFDQGPASMPVAGLCEAARATPFSTGIVGRRPSQVRHALAGRLNTGEIAQFGHEGDGHGALHAPQRLEGLDHWGQTPGGDLSVQCLFKPPEACRVFGDGPHICLDNERRRRRGTDALRSPAEVGRTPIGLARIAHSLPEENGVEAEFGGLASAQRSFTGPGAIATGVIFAPGNVDRCESTRVQEAGQLHRVPALGVHPVAGLWGNPCGRDDPADLPVLR